MKKVNLINMKIENFKGIKDLSIDFSKITNIFGENALGKTSIFDAFTWLMFDKDSKNRTKFAIKPLDENNQVVRGLKPTVIAEIEVNGNRLKLSKILEENWTKKRGESERKLTGNTTTYEINDVPVKLSDYKKKITEIGEETLFKLLTNPYYFSEILSDKERRNIVLEVAGDVTSGQVIDCNKELEVLRIELEKEDVDTILKSKKATISKLSNKKKEIKPRIEECVRSIVDMDFTELETDIEKKKALLEIVEDELLDSNKVNESILKKKEEIFEVKSKIQEINQKALNAGNTKKYDLMDQLRKLENEFSMLEMNKERLLNDKRYKENSKNMLEKEVLELREKFGVIQKQTIDFESLELECPTCKRAFETDDIEAKKQELTENFNQDKARKKAEINKVGQGKKQELSEIEVIIKEIDEKIATLASNIDRKLSEIADVKFQISEFKVEPNYSILDKENIDKLTNKLELLEKSVENPNNKDISSLRENKRSLINEINDITRTLAKKDLNKDLLVRKQELEEEEKELGVEIARQEGLVILCEQFIKARVALLEEKVSSKFKFARFKFTEELVNGAVTETCQATIDGVPFTSLNTASQINVGLDIINTLSNHYEIQIPVFIDNRESVNELIEIDSQIINLIVTKDNPLKIENTILEGVM